MAKGDIRLARLFYSIEADTKGLQQDLNAAERSFGRITDFIRANPVAAAGALAASFVAVGFEARAMAEETDQAMRRIGAVLPDAVGKFGELKSQLDEIAISSGVSQESLVQTAETIARAGVADLPELITRLKVVQETADATGADMGTLAVQLDQVLDTFGLAGDKIADVAAKLKAATQGKASINEILDAFQTAAPTLRSAGVDFDTGVTALAKLVSEGLNAKQAGSALKEMAAQGGQAIREFAGPAIDGAKALKDLHAAAQLVADGAQRQSATFRETWHALMREFGDTVGTVVNPALEAANRLLQQFVSHQAPAGSTIADVLASGLRGGPTTLGAGGGGIFAPRPAPSELAPLTVTKAQDDARVEAEAKAREAATQFASEAARQLASATGNVADGLILQLQDFLQKYSKVVNDLNGDQRTQANALIADLERRIAALQEASAEFKGLGANLGSLTDLTRNGATPEEEHALLQAAQQTGDVMARAGQAVAKTDADRLKTDKEITAEQLKQIRNIEEAFRGVTQLAEGLGLVDAKAASALGSISQIASSLAEASISGLDLSSALSIGGGLVSLVTGLIGGGETQDQRDLKELQKQLVESMAELKRSFDSFKLDATGTQQVTATKAIADILSYFKTGKFNEQVFRQIQGLGSGGSFEGVSLADLKALAQQFNLPFKADTFDEFTASLKALQDALESADRTRFLDSFTGQMQALNDRFQLFDITNPVDKLKAVLGVLTGAHGSPALAQALGGLDLGNAGDRGKAIKAIQDLFNRLDQGLIDAAGRGGLSSSDFEQELLQLKSLLSEANQQAGAGTNASFAVDRTVTEVTGGRIAAILDTQLTYQSALPEIRDLLTSVVNGSLLTAPSLPGAGAAAGFTLYVQPGAITVTVTAPAGSSAAAIATAVGGAVVDQLLASRAALKQAVAGGVLQ